jgi:ribosomal protein S18 acetylase RimI-like enzyme
MTAVREATRNDTDAAGKLLAAQLEEHSLPAAPQQIARGLEAVFAAGKSATLLLAEDEANRIASVEYGGTALFIEELFVLPESRNRGVGRALLAYLLKAARAEGLQAVELEVEPGHEPARHLYRSLHFVQNARTPLVLDLRKGS